MESHRSATQQGKFPGCLLEMLKSDGLDKYVRFKLLDPK
jgi:hypothetical protein